MSQKLKLLRALDFKRTPWKNGNGSTTQIAISPEGSDFTNEDFDWRVSTARVDESGDFSVFENYDRIITILGDKTAQLLHFREKGRDAELVQLAPWKPYRFPGDILTHCKLSGAGFQDLNVFFRKDRITATVEPFLLQPHQSQRWTPGTGTSLLFIVTGKIEASDIIAQEGEAIRFDRDVGMPKSPLMLKTAESTCRFFLVHLKL